MMATCTSIVLVAENENLAAELCSHIAASVSQASTRLPPISPVTPHHRSRQRFKLKRSVAVIRLSRWLDVEHRVGVMVACASILPLATSSASR